MKLSPEPPGDDVTVRSHGVANSLPAVDVPAAAAVTLTVPQPTFPPETCTALSAACETLDSGSARGESLDSTTVNSLAALLELDGPGSILVFGSLEKCMKF